MATNTELEEQNAELLARLDQLLEHNMELSNQVANLTKMLFGSRSEKRAILRKRFLRTKLKNIITASKNQFVCVATAR